MKKQRKEPLEFLSEIELGIKKRSLNRQIRSKLREWIIKLRIFAIRKMVNNDIELDRKIVSILSREIFFNGGTSENVEKKLYSFLDDCRERKSDEEFLHLIGLFKSTLPNY